jgi:hypothetical protein
MALEKIALQMTAYVQIVDGKIVASSDGHISLLIEGSVHNVAQALVTAMLEEYEERHQNLCEIVTAAADTFTQMIDEKKSGGISQDDTGQPGTVAQHTD